MAEAKITLVTEAKDEGLKKLNTELAAGMQNVAAMKRQLKDMEAATKQGTAATKEQADAMRKLRQEINEQTQANQQLGRAINSTVKEMEAAAKATAAADAGAAGLAGKFKVTEGFTTAFSVALGNLATTIMTGAVAALASLGAVVLDAGAKMQQTVAHLSAIKGMTENATDAYRAFNDVYRNTTYDESAVQQMGVQLMTLGYSAKNAADMIQLCADTSAGLGKGQAEAQAMVDTISRMQATGEATSKQFVSLQMAGLDLDKAFSKIGMTAEEAYKAMDEGTLDAQTAIGALTDYMHEFDGSMAKSKDNVIDAWSDVTGNLQTMCAEIGAGIMDAFNQSEIIQTLIDFTQDLIDMIRGEGCGAFSDLKEIAVFSLGIIKDSIDIIVTGFKFIILTLDSAYEAFKSFGRDVYEALQPVIDGLLYIYDLTKSILSSVGKGFAGEVNRSWKKTFGTDPDDADSYAIANNAGNHFRTVKRSVKVPAAAKTGGGSKSAGRSATKQLTEEERAVEALVKKYSDATKQKWAMAKSTIELAKVNVTMLTGEAKAEEEKRIKLEALKNAHDQMMEGYNEELKLANKIADEDTRNTTIGRIKEQIAAEEKLYEARVKAAAYASNLESLQEQSKKIIDTVLGDPDDWQARIRKMKDDLISAMAEIDAAAANPDQEAAVNTLAKLLNRTPESIQEELDAKKQTLAEFAEAVKTNMAETAAAAMNNEKSIGQWHDRLVNYATGVGKSMADAMTDWIMGEKSASEAMAEFAKNLIKTAVQLLAQWLALFAIFSIVGDPRLAARNASAAVFGAYDGKVSLRKAHGGYITGPGSGTSDSIPAMLSNGEYVIRSAAVDQIGRSTLDAINAGRIPEFSEGGTVDDTLAANAGGASVTLQVSAIDASSFAGFLDRGGLDRIKQALFEENRRFRSATGVW